MERRGVLGVCDGRGIARSMGIECVLQTVKGEGMEGCCDMGWVGMLGMRAVEEGWWIHWSDIMVITACVAGI